MGRQRPKQTPVDWGMSCKYPPIWANPPRCLDVRAHLTRVRGKVGRLLFEEMGTVWGSAALLKDRVGHFHEGPHVKRNSGSPT